MRYTKKKMIGAAVTAAVLGMFCWVNNKWLVTNEYTVHSPKVTESINIVQISDLHNTRFGGENHRLTEKIEACDPDVIVITGDIVDERRTNIPIAVEFCRKAADIAPCYYVDGNHEVLLEDDERQQLYDGIREAGVSIINNASDTIDVKGCSVQLMGLEDEHLTDETQTRLNEGLDPELPTILLAHEPQEFESYCSTQPDLVLCGHAHGGQFRFFGRGVFAPDQGLFPKYTAGAFESGDTTMIVSRGLGNSAFPLRLFDLPEVVCVHLEK